MADTTATPSDLTAVTADAPASACSHHWMLGIPGRSSTAGTCKHCGVTREFNDVYQAPSGRTPRNVAKKPTT